MDFKAPSLSQTIGSKIRKLRELRDYKQEHLAERLGISQSYYARIEKNAKDAKLSQLEEIASILGVDLMHLLQFDATTHINYVSGNHVGIGSGQYVQHANPANLDDIQAKLDSLQTQLVQLASASAR